MKNEWVGGPPPTLADVLDEVYEYINSIIHFQSDHQAIAVTLFAINTYVFDQWDTTPYLAVSSPEKRSGKSLLIDVLILITARPVATSTMSLAVLFRMVEERHPTLMIDETDAIFGTRARPENEDLRGLINAGFKRGRPAHRMGGPNRRTVEEFDPYCPKVLAGIGELPDTVADRSIPIRLQRKPRSIRKRRFRLRVEEPKSVGRRERIEYAVEGLDLGGDWPELPDELGDRAQDMWEPLLALADKAGDRWPDAARAAARALHSAGDEAEGSIGIRLLSEIRDVFGDDDRLSTTDLLDRLHDLEESPWGDWYGKPINARWLATKLKPYGVHSQNLRTTIGVLKGYERASFIDVWDRYLSDPVTGAATSATSATNPASIDESDDTASRYVPLQSATGLFVADVADVSRIDDSLFSPIDTGDVADVADVADTLTNVDPSCPVCGRPYPFGTHPMCLVEAQGAGFVGGGD